jgi:hypothetical protein
MKLEVVEISTGKIVHTIDCGQKSDRSLDTVGRGLMRNMDLERFFVRRKE